MEFNDLIENTKHIIDLARRVPVELIDSQNEYCSREFSFKKHSESTTHFMNYVRPKERPRPPTPQQMTSGLWTLSPSAALGHVHPRLICTKVLMSRDGVVQGVQYDIIGEDEIFATLMYTRGAARHEAGSVLFLSDDELIHNGSFYTRDSAELFQNEISADPHDIIISRFFELRNH